ncbi:MAG: biotin transporter BioY [Candidatus Omnitrophota bacterium]|jgi:biotin transport system substrate-specific component|nr:MAG: biotin transporter BioY [Candidatus Omnitrophota bacterium]
MEVLLKREIVLSKAWCRLFGVMAFVILTSLGGYVRIPLPFTPVPLTLQTFFVLLSGAFLGGLGAVTQILYILLGLSGITLFTYSGSGIVYLFGPTGGYLAGFVAASFLVSALRKVASRSLSRTIGVFFLADSVLLAIGAVWLGVFLHISVFRAFLIGFLPFLIGDLLKAIVAASLYWKTRDRIREIF